MIKERQTKQKAVILSAVQGTKTHPTAEQVYEMIRDEMPNVSLGTVYRNLNRLAEIGTIRRISVINSPDKFDGDLTPHHHISCTQCGKFCDFFDAEYNESLDRFIEAKTSFRIAKHETVFYGVCPECKCNELN
ncbi:MAG: transcriptional repressor [Clostridia bacterium]|nr:transcriptional repressor [Clostridia bacterium]MBR6784234.1 transcriptional repressor [Clostridia bacterium]